jgi:hypothetical protein
VAWRALLLSGSVGPVASQSLCYTAVSPSFLSSADSGLPTKSTRTYLRSVRQEMERHRDLLVALLPSSNIKAVRDYVLPEVKDIMSPSDIAASLGTGTHKLVFDSGM